MPSFVAVGKLGSLGFDDEVTPPWVMVPNGGVRNVGLRDGQGLTLSLRGQSAVASVSFQELAQSDGKRIIQLTGLTAKTVFLDAKKASGAVAASLEISVKDRLRLATFIAFVFDKARRGPVRGLDDALHAMTVANKILLPQTNVEMFRKDSGGIRLPFKMPRGLPADLSAFEAPQDWMRGGPGLLPCIMSQPPGPDGCMPETSQGSLSVDNFRNLVEYQMMVNLVGRVNPVFDYNILCVRNFATTTGSAALTRAFTPTALNGVALPLCIMPDPASGHQLAHELGHYLLRSSPLGSTAHSSGKDDLMTEAPGPNNLKIPKLQANAMNPSGSA